jgi:predicted CXXCH cytochrome family protein
MRPPAAGERLRLAEASFTPPYLLRADGSVEGPAADGSTLKGHVAFLIGGKHREDVVVRLPDGRMQLFPWSYDVDRKEAFEPLAALAGGTTPPPDVVDFWTRAGRNAMLTCYGCHATGQTLVASISSTPGVTIPEARWIEPGVGCEGCHGPGGPHVDAARAKRPLAGTVKMAHGEASVDACAACHGLRDVLPSPFSPAPAHRYGDPLYAAADPLLTVGSSFEFREPFFEDLRPATYQQEAVGFSQSGCARRGAMTCAACHDVHSGALRVAADGGDALCASCHAPIVAQGLAHTLHARGTPGGRCLDCHMAAILRGPGGTAARDHTMAPPVANTGQVPAACAACHTGGSNAAAVATAWRKRADGPAAKRRREIGLAVDGAETAQGSEALVKLVAQADAGWFLRWAALRRIESAATARRTETMAAAFHAGLTDANPALRREAARALGRFGRPTDFEALQHATDDADPWTALAAVLALGKLGAPTASARLPEVMQRPDLIAVARAQYAYGHVLVLARDWVRAEALLRRALELNPIMVGAINDLGLCLRGQGKPKDAEAAWKLALEINPRFESARQNLAQAGTAATAP